MSVNALTSKVQVQAFFSDCQKDLEVYKKNRYSDDQIKEIFTKKITNSSLIFSDKPIKNSEMKQAFTNCLLKNESFPEFWKGLDLEVISLASSKRFCNTKTISYVAVGALTIVATLPILVGSADLFCYGSDRILSNLGTSYNEYFENFFHVWAYIFTAGFYNYR